MTNPNPTDTSRSGDLVNQARLDAKSFRENTIYTMDGDPIRLIVNADRLDQYADRIEALEAEVEGLRKMLKVTHNLAVAYAVGTGTLFDEAMAEVRAALGEK